MKETPLTLCERVSLISNLESNIRFDGRSFQEIRPTEIHFGKHYGCCSVTLGETRVLAQVSCEIVEPRPSRPNEGKLSIFVHLSPMAASHFEQGRVIDLSDELQHILDRNIKESKCLDLESLCISAEESVWQLRLDVTVLNHAGNLGDACNLAGVAALRHFHRPDVTVEEDGRITIHTQEEREFLPTFLKKIPVCLTYALFMVDKRCITLLDPTEKEERVMSGKFIVGLNPHGEITSLLFPGKVCLEKKIIMNCISKAFLKAKSLAETVLKAIDDDLEMRKTTNDPPGFINTLKSDREYVKSLLMKRIESAGRRMEAQKMEEDDEHEPMEIKEEKEGEESDKDDEMSDSDDEFTPESLSKNLDQIRAEKKAQIKATHSGNKDYDDDEIESKTIQLDKNSL